MKQIKYEKQSRLILDGHTEVTNFKWYFVVVINLSGETVHVSRYRDIHSRIGTTDVLTLAPGETGYISVGHGVKDGFYVIGNGVIEIIPSNDEEVCVRLVSALMGVGEGQNPNLLINPDFAVNQRGVSGTITASGYFVDRWKLESGTVTLNADGTLTLNGTISQTLEKAVGAEVTAHASAGTALYDNSTKTFTLTAAGEVIEWAKLEKGAVKTPYSPPDMATEIVKCKRFYQRYYASEMTPSHMINSGTHVIRQTIPEMINTPQVSYHWRYGADENILIDSNNTPHAADFSTSSYTNKKLLEMVITSEAATAWCYLPMDGDSYCELSAEL